MLKPNFFIVGAPKCGTTAMYEYLKAHPEIYMGRKEMHFFAPAYHPWRSDRPTTLEDYLAYFDAVTDEKRIGEASVLYLYDGNAAERIYRFNPDAKIIIMLRNPVDMIYSWYYEMRNTGDEILPTFEQALEAEADRHNFELIPKRSTAEKLWYRDIASYSEQVKRYYETFGSGQVHVVVYDDFSKNTPIVYRDTLTFLGVDTCFQPDFKIINANKIPRSHLFNRLTRKPPMWYVRLKAIPRALTSVHVRNALNKTIQKWMTKVEKRSPMQPETRKMLQQNFYDDVVRLSELLNRDLTHWCYDPK